MDNFLVIWPRNYQREHPSLEGFRPWHPQAHLAEPHSCCPTGQSPSRALEDDPPGTARGHWAWDSSAGSCHQNSHLNSVSTQMVFQHHQPNVHRFSWGQEKTTLPSPCSSSWQHDSFPLSSGMTDIYIYIFFFLKAGQSNFLSLELLKWLEKVSSLTKASSASEGQHPPSRSRGVWLLLIPLAVALCTGTWKEKYSGMENFRPKG